MRIAATLAALTLGTAGLTALAPSAALAADGPVAGDTVAKLPISSYSAMVVDSVHERVYITDDRRDRGRTRSMSTTSRARRSVRCPPAPRRPGWP
ncbi:hypothetical protein ACFQ2K_23855 [Streptomyces sanglieri]|uniref:Uncharacterized protein n=1 Tax=Streptomyces sanglieri TaxID=193460 RepID=A0ABW2WV84_9ACTN